MFQTCRTFAMAVAVFLLVGQNAPGEDLASDATLISGVDIAIENPPPYGTAWQAMAADLIHLKRGDRFSSEALAVSLENLALSKQFTNIHADSEQSPDGMRLIFELTPSPLIKNIIIKGRYPLFERDITTALGIYVGGPYAERQRAEQASIIADLYRKQGFAAPKVAVSADRDVEDGYMVVSIEIDRGASLKLRSLNIEGNEAYSDLWLKLKMKSWRASKWPVIPRRFVAKVLDEDIENLTAFYRKKGFADVEIESRIEINEAEAAVSADLHITEGRRYDWGFRGNQAFRHRTLKRDVVLATLGNMNNRGLRESRKNILTRYRNAGYLKARVVVREQGAHESQRKLHFSIDEGPCTRVASVNVKGNNSIDTETLKQDILTRPPSFLEKGLYNEDTLEEDVAAIKTAYLREGYTEPEIAESVSFSPQRDLASVVLEIDEGVRTWVRSVTATGVTAVASDQVYQVLQLKKDDPYRAYMVTSDENALAALISEKGYPHVKVTGRVVISDDKSGADVVYEVDEGPAVRMGNTYFSGNFRTRDKVLRRELDMAPGDAFSLVRYLKGQRNLNNLGILRSVNLKTIGLRQRSDVIHGIVETVELKPYYIESSLGYESETGSYMDATAGDRNLFGYNKHIWIGAEHSETGSRTELGVSEPRFLGTRISADYGLFAEEEEEFNQDFGSRGYGVTMQLNQRRRKQWLVGLGFRLEHREQYPLASWDPPPGGDERELFDQRVFAIISPAATYDGRDSYVRPTLGLYASASIDISKGIRATLDDFVTGKLDFRFYTTPLPRTTFAGLLRLGHIVPYGASDALPDDQLFFLGGTADVRGFNENELAKDVTGDPVGGETSIAASLEARIDLGKNFELTLFYDTGRLSNTSAPAQSEGFRHAAGGGIRYITPIGPIGFLYGIKLDTLEGESSGRLHFSLGYTF